MKVFEHKPKKREFIPVSLVMESKEELEYMNLVLGDYIGHYHYVKQFMCNAQYDLCEIISRYK